MKKIITFLYATFVFLIIDYFWLTVIAYDFFQKYLGHMMRTDIILWSALAFYLIFNFALCVFAIYPCQKTKDVKKATLLGALLGFVCYSSFDFTSYAIFKGYPIEIIAIDILWGTFLGAITAAVVVQTKHD